MDKVQKCYLCERMDNSVKAKFGVEFLYAFTGTYQFRSLQHQNSINWSPFKCNKNFSANGNFTFMSSMKTCHSSVDFMGPNQNLRLWKSGEKRIQN